MGTPGVPGPRLRRSESACPAPAPRAASLERPAQPSHAAPRSAARCRRHAVWRLGVRAFVNCRCAFGASAATGGAVLAIQSYPCVTSPASRKQNGPRCAALHCVRKEGHLQLLRSRPRTRQRPRARTQPKEASGEVGWDAAFAGLGQCAPTVLCAISCRRCPAWTVTRHAAAFQSRWHSLQLEATTGASLVACS